MPFDESRILFAPRGGRRRAERRPWIVAGGGPVSVGQPRFSPDGSRLAYVSDATGWWNVWVADADGAHAHPVLDEAHDHAAPTWSPGQRSFAWAPDGAAIAICRNEDGFGRLIVVPVSGRKAAAARDVREVAKGWHHSLDWGPGGIVATRSGARTPPTITVVDPDTADRRVLARGAPAGIERGAVEPEAVTWASGTETVHGLLSRPSSAALGADTAPPMLVLVHGGPSDQATVVWQPRGRVLRRPRVGGAAARPPRLDRVRPPVRPGPAGAVGRARRRGHRRGHPGRGRAGLVRPGSRRGHGRECGRAHRVAPVRAATGRW